MNKDEEIRILVARFMDGDTTLDEESKLYCYFSGDEVSDDLLPMREYFCSIAVMCTPKHSQYKGKPVLLGLLSRPLFIGIAASLALLVAVGVGNMLWRSEPQDYCEAYIYNRYVTSPGTVMKEVDGTLQAIRQDGESNVEGQLHDIFGNQ